MTTTGFPSVSDYGSIFTVDVYNSLIKKGQIGFLSTIYKSIT